MTKIRQRYRIRFRKLGDLRLISHRDLVRTWERTFRRAELELSMSEGFHPKARMSCPSALALGVEALDEVMELELAEHITASALEEKLRAHAPPGLEVAQITILDANNAKAQVERLTYEFPLPEHRRAEVAAAMDHLISLDTYLVDREGRSDRIDLRPGIHSLEVHEDRLRMVLNTSRTATVRPREVLTALGIGDLEGEGCYLTRTAVEIAS